MLTREGLYHRILILIPDARFSFWPNDGHEEEYGEDGAKYYKIDEWCIAWYKENTSDFPTEESIKAISDDEVVTDIEKRRKNHRNEIKSKDLGIIAAYRIEKKSNPSISFSDYLDELEKMEILNYSILLK